MDPYTARAWLRLDPTAPLTVDRIESAAAQAAWASHPSRAIDEASRREAERATAAIAVARATLLHELAAAPRRHLSGGAIAGIVIGSVATLALLVVAVFAGVAAVRPLVDTAASGGSAGPGEHGVDRYSALETLFTFPAALEVYTDGRLDDLCSEKFEKGCWETAVFPLDKCRIMSVTIGYTNDEDGVEPEFYETQRFQDAESGEEFDVVFGNDLYDYGWVNDVNCHDSAA
ncbi:hypothetical protein ET445_09530 [Agromyces protaetiae]|uniref:Uncharacterized protein n=1 Tax=Agromyces protaetiae TaxID=2509455 RepID=A0A4P6FC01_9MICO|nr:hypothetical protein [Agromyces protaetiae]QAY73542.1 hypothetical protein ET445_09530 [Agromyces protaetiae]